MLEIFQLIKKFSLLSSKNEDLNCQEKLDSIKKVRFIK